MSNFYIRPIQESDFDEFYAMSLAEQGMMSLPKDRSLLKQKLEKSILSFQKKIPVKQDAYYLFTLIDAAKNQLIGMSGISFKCSPYFYYHLPRMTPYASHVLTLKEYTEPSTMICSFLLKREYRGQGLAKLLSFCRFIFMSEFRDLFFKDVLSEMRGLMYENDVPVFWQEFAHQVYQMELSEAQRLYWKRDAAFANEIKKKFPISFKDIPESAKIALGHIHPDTQPAYAILLKQGFHYDYEVDLFDGAPILRAEIDGIKTVQKHKKAKVSAVSQMTDTDEFILTNCHLDYRACLGNVVVLDASGVEISEESAKILKVGVGDSIYYLV